MSETLNRPLRNTPRNGAKIVEWVVVASGAAVIFENLGIAKTISSFVANFARSVIDFLPNFVDVITNIPLPDFIIQAIANTKFAQDVNLLLSLAVIWAAARLIATIFRLMGAQRGKVENIFGTFTKVLIGLVLLSEGVKFAFGMDTIDLFRGLIPFAIEKGGDVPEWLAKSNTRELAWAICSSITGVLMGVWAYLSNIRPEQIKKEEKEYLRIQPQ
ncbi:MAG: hypothetical protein COB56_01480 [Robiginitomaculum sp.]|nr:MAG: hypothetical protein COB56_01480 [Robiginitomaculum sp.]